MHTVLLPTPTHEPHMTLLLLARSTPRAPPSGPRPAQVISLEEFSEESIQSRWTHACRCGGAYAITEKDMENDRHLIACERCSEVVYVGYEVVEEEEEEDSTRE